MRSTHFSVVAAFGAAWILMGSAAMESRAAAAPASPPGPRYGKVVSALHDTYKVDYIAPGHCTGEPTFAALKKVFGDRYHYGGLGTALGVGANPRSESDSRVSSALSDSDLKGFGRCSPKAMSSMTAAPRLCA